MSHRMTMTATQAMTDVVASGGERVTGGLRVEDIAQEWLDAGLTAGEAETYIDAGCWDADRVAALVVAGVSADALSDDDVASEVARLMDRAGGRYDEDGVLHCGSRYADEGIPDGLAYAHSNGDVSTAMIVAAVRAVRA